MSESLLVVDNYDSFTFNLVQYLAELGETVVVRRNDISVEQIEAERPYAIVLSPGPGTPSAAGVCNPLVRRLAGSIPILGVCLGHECIGEVFGGTISPASRIMHGKVSSVRHAGDALFEGLPNPFAATRYHSLALDADSVPASLQVIAWAEDGTIMAIRHRQYAVIGVQFHPESILTEGGHQLLKNFVSEARVAGRRPLSRAYLPAGLDTSVSGRRSAPASSS